jgi:deaminated glutathione amidase
MSKLKIAISQFPVSVNIDRNLRYIIKHTKKAAKLKADVIHFPELSLTGYETKIDHIDWSQLIKSIKELKDLAKNFKIYIVLGLHQKSPNKQKPFNSTLLITDAGKEAGQYVKSHLYGNEKDRFESRVSSFTYEIKGVKCGFLICFDSNFQNLFREYKDKGVEILFLSYYNAKSTKPRNSMDELMRAQFITRSTDNRLYISGSNSSSHYSRMPSSFVSPDGNIISAKRHVPGIIIGEYPNPNLGWTYNNLH